ncbi:endonuclease domain-containing protein [Niveispirillum sp.]|uniref:endonuclease domain-containing protein n=1 Tax=Niveispirillum sp. TaxID=1917217 RepID=UPI001B528B40|nr:DUF559 domain-containing protein [Niveispirillum sp.]MBP7339979.1 endonuclease domain-containing protein [Niveispirillum sp.]
MTGDARARHLRRTATDAERRFWGWVRDRRFLGLKFRRQERVDRYIADFICPEMNLIVEIDGSQHNPVVDATRTAALERAGFTVLRFDNHYVLTNRDGVLRDLAHRIGRYAEYMRGVEGMVPATPVTIVRPVRARVGK